MITKRLPGFSFTEPTNRDVINIRVESRIVVGETRALRTIWTPEMAQDIMAYQNIDAEAELTALLTEHLRQEIDDQIIRDLRDPVRNHLNQWAQFIHRGNRAPQDEPPRLGGNDFDNITFPTVRRVAAQTIGLDLVGVQPLNVPTGLLNYLDDVQSNYIILPNEEGWYTNDTYESIFINMYLKPYKFLQKSRRSRRNFSR